MKTEKKLLLLLAGILSISKTIVAEAIPVTQEIRYQAAGATAVELVWGVNDWQNAAKETWPEETYLKDNLLNTPMERLADGSFSCTLSINQGTTVDFVFHIIRGPAGTAIDAWDVNQSPQKDYHVKAVNDNVSLIVARDPVTPKEPYTPLDYSGKLMLLALAVSVICIPLIRRSPAKPGFNTITLSAALVTIIVLWLFRPAVAGFSWELFYNPLDYLKKIPFAGYDDFKLVLIISVPVLLIQKYVPLSRKLQVLITSLFCFLCLVIMTTGILHVRVFQMLGKPFTWQWLYYSDFLKSADAKSALAANVSSEYILQIIMICLSACLMVFATAVALQYLHRMRNFNTLKIISGMLVILFLLPAVHNSDATSWTEEQIANPVTAFVESANPFREQPALFTMPLPDKLAHAFDRMHSGRIILPAGTSIKNVIIFVLESTPAEYIHSYNNQYNLTPVLDKYNGQSIRFTNVYAHAPATNVSMVSLLTSLYPWLSYNSITAEHPDINVPSLSSELKKYNYRTGFFNSADNRFQGAGDFLRLRLFDTIQDCSNCKKESALAVEDKSWKFMNGSNDESTAADMLNWISSSPSSPFMAVMWTYQTHYPYFCTGNEEHYADEPVLNRYLNAVHHSDLALGNLLKGLTEKGLLNSTLVVVIGDHGEAFGRHNQTTHATHIYEENLHIPCILINPSFSGKIINRLGGMTDIAPTVMSLLQKESPAVWQGESLFADGPEKKIYFFAPWSDYLFGYRENNMKYIFNATKSTTEIYDLSTDPHETKNLADQLPGAVEGSHQELAAWAQYVNHAIGGLIEQKAILQKMEH